MTLVELVGDSRSTSILRERIRKVAPTSARVLILGEPGTGKEVIARCIHAQSNRKGSYIVVNCGAIPESLVEAELFGVAKGAYTGASVDRPGVFERAHAGTVFLDEVGELPLPAQVKLLRVLQEGEVERVGSGRTTKVDVRVIAATNVDLESATRARTFRKDLFDRLNVYPLRTTPLRERMEDLEPLIHSLLPRYKLKLDFSQEALQALRSHRWDGNVRELCNILERLGVISSGRVTSSDVEEAFSMDGPRSRPEPLQASPERVERPANVLSLDVLEAILDELQAIRSALKRPLEQREEMVLAAPQLGAIKLGEVVSKKGLRGVVVEAKGELLTVELEPSSGFLASFGQRFEQWRLGEVEEG